MAGIHTTFTNSDLRLVSDDASKKGHYPIWEKVKLKSRVLPNLPGGNLLHKIENIKSEILHYFFAKSSQIMQDWSFNSFADSNYVNETN